MLALIALFSLVTVLWAAKSLRSPIAKIPGPTSNIFTSLYLKYKEFSRQRRVYIHNLHHEYGPVVRLGPNEVSFATADAVKEIYQSGGSGYDRTELYDLFKQFDTRTLFSTPRKAGHSQRKRILADKYANTNVMRPEHLQGLKDHAQTFLQNCTLAIDSEVDAYIQLHCFALDGASQFLFHPNGTRSLSDPQDLEMMKELTYHDSLKRKVLRTCVSGQKLTSLENLLQYYAPTVASFIERTSTPPRYAQLANQYVLETSKKASSAPFSLISRLQSKAADLPELAIPAECMDHLAAGIDTTGDGLCFLMHELSLLRSQYAQRRLQQELLDNPDIPFDQLPYLDAIVKEGLRCFPPIPMSFPRYVPAEGRTISGFWVPGGTIVSAQPYTLHKNEGVFPRPLDFVPERWLSEQGAGEREVMYFAFSKGSRGCLGRNLAMAEMKILLREVYSQCSTRVSDRMDGSMEPNDQIISSRPKDQTCLLVFEKLKVDGRRVE